MEAARRAEKELGAEIVIIKKTSKEYSQEKDPPSCPSVIVNGRIVSAVQIGTMPLPTKMYKRRS
jgi:hypothetical protein